MTTAWAVAAIAALMLSNTTWAKVHSSPSPSGMQPQAGSSTQQQPQRTSLNAQERNFLQSAAEINATEVQMGQIAERQSNDPNIKQIGQQLVKDHSAALDQVQKLAASKGVIITAQPNVRQQRMLSSLQSKSGNDFNKAFLRQSTLGHERAISLFDRASRRSQDQDVKGWASQILPSLQEHLAMSRSGKPEAIAEKTKRQQQQQQQQFQGSPSPGQQQMQHKHTSPSGSPSSGGY